MKTTIDYSKSPAKAFDAVEDIKSYLGTERWAAIYPEFAKIGDCNMFAAYCGLAGIEGYPVRAWYDHYWGQGAWDKWQADYSDHDV